MPHQVIETLKGTKIGASEKRVQNRFCVKLILAAAVSIGLTSVTIKPTYSQGGSWERLSGAATDIGVGANGAVFTIGTNRSDGGYGIWKWTGNQWQALPGGGVRIAVDPSGNPWVVNDRGTIFQWRGGSWAKLPGSATDIGIGANGSVFITGTERSDGGYGIWKWRHDGWQQIPGGSVNVSVGPSGTPWVTNSSNNIFRKGDDMGSVLTPSVQASPSVPAQGGAASCSRNVRAQNSNTPVTVTFVNKSGEYRGVMWVDLKGKWVLYAKLNPGQSYTVNTYVTYPWVFTDGPGNCVEMFMPRKGVSTFNITAKSVQANCKPDGQSCKKNQQCCSGNCQKGTDMPKGICLHGD